MLLSAIISSILFLNSWGSLVVGQRREGWLTSAQTDITKNAFIDEFKVRLIQTENNTFVTMSMHVTKTLPMDIMIWWWVRYNDETNAGHKRRLCDYLRHKTIGPYIRTTILPKDKFPQKCPIIAGNWSIEKWEPLWTLIPLTLPDGPFHGIVWIHLEGEHYYAQIDFRGVISQTLP